MGDVIYVQKNLYARKYYRRWLDHLEECFIVSWNSVGDVEHAVHSRSFIHKITYSYMLMHCRDKSDNFYN